MAQITVTGVIKDLDGDFPSSGIVAFQQSGMFIDASGAIIPATSETTPVTPGDGTFSMTLASTLDGIPSTVSYAVSFTGVIDGAPVTQTLGTIQLAPSPSSVLLKDLLIAGLSGGVAVTPTLAAADVALTLKETDQTLPSGLWRIRVSGDILTLEKNAAAAGDFSTLSEIFRSTSSLFTLSLPERINAQANAITLLSLKRFTDTAPTGNFLDYQNAAGTSLYTLNILGAITKYAGASPLDGQILIGGTAAGTFQAATLTAGTNITIMNGNGVITIASSASGGVTSAIGTTNQVNVSSATGAVTFSLPQSIDTGATPQFARLGLGVAADATATLKASGHVILEGVTSTGATGTGKLVFDGTPTLVTPVLGVATGTSLNLSGALQCGSITNSSGLAAGVYTPTLTGVANIQASVAYQCQYCRVGSVVIVSGRVDIDPTTSGVQTQLRMSLPVASNIGNIEDCGGVASCTFLQQTSPIYGDITNDAALFDYIAASAANGAFLFTFVYRVI